MVAPGGLPDTECALVYDRPCRPVAGETGAMGDANSRKRTGKGVLGWIALGLVAAVAWAAEPTVTEVIPLRHRTLEQVLPVIQTLAGPEGAVTGIGNRLVVRATPRRLAEIRRVVEEIDTPPRRLLVSVRQDGEGASVRRGVEISARARLGGEARAAIPPSERTDGRELDAVYSSGDARLRARIGERRVQERERGTQTLQVLEGGEAFIQVGAAAPVPERTVVETPHGTRIVESVQYREAATGFYVRPLVSGDSVLLSIRTVRDRFTGDRSGGIDTQQVETQVSARLGEWIELGAVAQDRGQGATAIFSRGEASEAERRRVFIKVDELR